MNEKQEGLSISEFFHIIFKRKLPLLVATGSITVAGILGMQFGYNNFNEVYESEFVYINSSLKEGTYYNGIEFNYASLVSDANIDKVISSNNDFSSINSNKLKGSISISKNLVFPNPYVMEDQYTTYTITAIKSAFKDDKQAKDFISALADSASKENINIINSIDYSKALVKAKQAKSYDLQLESLKAQYDFMFLKYESLLETFPGYVLNNGESLSEAFINLKAAYAQLGIEEYQNYANTNGLVKDYSYSKDLLLTQKESLENDICHYEAMIEDIVSTRNSTIDYLVGKGINVESFEIETYNNQINTYVILMNLSKQELEYVNKKLSCENPIDAVSYSLMKNHLEKGIDNALDVLTKETETLAKFEQTVGTNGDHVQFSSSSIVSSKNGLGIAESAGLFLVVGFLVGAILNLVLESKSKKN